MAVEDAAVMSLAIGTRLKNYEIVATLGAGGMGEVYRARDTKLGRDVALKVLPAEVSANPERLARFEREARTVASLTHPNIVVLHSMEEESSIHFLTMELVDGDGLDRHVTPAGLPAPRVVEMGIALADALAAAHERGVVHRDLKPSNVMLSRDGRVKVLDFGLAKLAEIASNTTLSHAATMAAPISEAGVVVGTVPYMAPEQIRGDTVDARTDLFALGIVLYELASGRRPFAGTTNADVSSAILRDPPEPLTRVRTGLPVELDRIVSRCLEKSPPQRYQTALDVADELRRLRKQLEGGEILAAGPASGQVISIAVLPFVNRSASVDDEYFSDGLADELLNVLAKIKGLRVIARTSSFQFKGTKDDIATIGRKLDVVTVVEGSVRKAGPRVRISVQLVKVADSSHLWSESYDRSLDDIFAVQDDIAQSVVKELRTTLLGESADSDAIARAKADVGAAVLGHGQNAEAHRLYLQGKYFVDRLTEADTARGIGYLEQALALDAAHAAAWSTLSRAHVNSGGFGWEPLLEAFRLARAAAQRSMALAPNLAEAHSTMAMVQRLHDWDWRGAEQSCRRALDLAPENAEALHSYGWLCFHVGQFSDAEALLMRSIDRDPLTVDGYVGLGMLYRSMDRPAEAERWLRKAIELIPQAIHTRYVLALLLAAQGRDAEAIAVAMEEPARWGRLTALACAHHLAGRHPASDDALHKLEAELADHSAFQIAQAHGARGEIDDAFVWLERAFAQRDPGMAWMKFEPCLASLHGDPRWGALLSRLGLAD
jgi:serine/threonine protein kinase/tetratricopeptide (TPR) repeat protein